MAIFSPEIRLTPDSKRLLELLAALLSEEHNVDTSGTNRSADHLPLSDSQAEELASLITALLKNKDFLDKIAFIEGISAVKDTTDGKSLRKSYITGDLRPMFPPGNWRICRFDFDLMRPAFAKPFSWHIR